MAWFSSSGSGARTLLLGGAPYSWLRQQVSSNQGMIASCPLTGPVWRYRSIDKDNYRVDRDNLLLPEIMVESLDDPPGMFMKPVFDMVWQSAGQPGSPNYDESGQWSPSPAR